MYRSLLLSVASVGILVAGCGTNRTVALDSLPVRRISWANPLPHVQSPLWQTTAPTKCSVTLGHAIRQAISHYPTRFNLPERIYAQRAGLVGGRVGDKGIACAYVIEFWGTALERWTGHAPPPDLVITVVDGQDGNIKMQQGLSP